MSTILQDMMGMLKRNKTVTPKSDNYMTVARYPNPQERLKPAPKLQTELVTLSALKTYFNTGKSAVSSIVAGTNVTISPAGGTGAVTVNATVPALPYASSIVRIFQSGTDNPNLSFISNDAELTLASDTRIGLGRYRFTFSSAPAKDDVMVILPGGARTGEWNGVALFSTYRVSGGTGTLLIESYGITNTNTLEPADIGFGGDNSIIVEIRVFS